MHIFIFDTKLFSRTHDMREPMTYSQLAAILRLGKKYEMDYIWNEGLRRLRTDFPTTLDDWDNQLKFQGELQISQSDT